MNLSIKQVELLLLESAFERTKEFEHRCRRRAQAAAAEARQSSDTVIKLANQVEVLRRELLRDAK